MKVTIKLAGSLTREQKQKVAEEITATLERHAGKPASYTYIAFEELPDENWAIAGVLLIFAGLALLSVPGKDGTQVPMYLTHKKGLVRDGQNPTLLYGYGGFNIPMTPGFSFATAKPTLMNLSLGSPQNLM